MSDYNELLDRAIDQFPRKYLKPRDSRFLKLTL